GTLTLDFSVNGGDNILNSGSPLVFGSNYLGGGTLAINGKSGATDSQTFSKLILVSGGNTITNNLNSGTACTLVCGAITRNAGGGTVDFGSSGTSVTAPITTTTVPGAGGILGGYATVAGSDWATTNGSVSPYPIIAL